MKQVRTAALVVTGLSAILLIGCGGDSSGDAPEEQIGTRNGEEQGAIEQNNGGKNLDAPDGFPDDVPIYPGLNIHAANKMGVAYMLGATSMDDPATIAAFYQKEMLAEGWAAQGVSQPLAHMFGDRYTKGNRSVNVTIGKNAEGQPNQVSIVVNDPDAGQ